MFLKGYYALKCVGARFLSVEIIAIDGKYRNFLLRLQRTFYYVTFCVFTAMTMKISCHLVFCKFIHISDHCAAFDIRTAGVIYKSVLRHIPEDSSLHGLVNTHRSSSSSA
jgi:hypothetical protein